MGLFRAETSKSREQQWQEMLASGTLHEGPPKLGSPLPPGHAARVSPPPGCSTVGVQWTHGSPGIHCRTPAERTGLGVTIV